MPVRLEPKAISVVKLVGTNSKNFTLPVSKWANPGDEFVFIQEGMSILVEKYSAKNKNHEGREHSVAQLYGKPSATRRPLVLKVPKSVFYGLNITDGNYVAVKKYLAGKKETIRLLPANDEERANAQKVGTRKSGIIGRVGTQHMLSLPAVCRTVLGITKDHPFCMASIDLTGGKEEIILYACESPDGLISLKDAKRVHLESFYTQERRFLITLNEKNIGSMYLPAAFCNKIDCRVGDTLDMFWTTEPVPGLHIGRQRENCAICGTDIRSYQPLYTRSVFADSPTAPCITEIAAYAQQVQRDGKNPKTAAKMALTRAKTARKPGRPKTKTIETLRILEDYLTDLADCYKEAK